MRFSYISRYTPYISKYTIMVFSSRGSVFQMYSTRVYLILVSMPGELLQHWQAASAAAARPGQLLARPATAGQAGNRGPDLQPLALARPMAVRRLQPCCAGQTTGSNLNISDPGCIYLTVFLDRYLHIPTDLFATILLIIPTHSDWIPTCRYPILS